MVTSPRDPALIETLKSIVSFQNHPAFAAPEIDLNEQYSDARDKIFGMAQALLSQLERTPAQLTSGSALQTLFANLAAPLNELTAFTANSAPGHLLNAARQFEDNVVPIRWAVDVPIDSVKGHSAAQLFETQINMALQRVKSLDRQRSEISAKLSSIESAAQAQILRMEQINESSARERAEAAAAVAKLDQQFAQQETVRSAQFEEAVRGLRDEFDIFQHESSGVASKLIEDLTAKQADAARIVQVVGNIGVTGNYQQIANAEGAQADFWRWVTVGIFSVAIVFAAATFYKFWHETVSVENTWSIAIRLLYALAITGPALYTSRESARHRTNADRARQTELELASIGPFIELMPEDKKNSIREKLTGAYFGRAVEPHNVDVPIDVSAVKDLVVEVIKAARKG